MTHSHSTELSERSPLRVLDRSIHGGLGTGNLGVVCAGPGAGKTAFLVAVALDHLLRDRQVLHVALDHTVDRVRNYYDEIFAELARTEHLADTGTLRRAIETNRRIQCYAPHAFDVAGLGRTLDLFREHAGAAPSLLLVDGWDWDSATTAQLVELKQLAARAGAELWLSARLDRTRPVEHPRGWPEPVARFEDQIDVLLRLKGDGGSVHLELLKDHGYPVEGRVALDLDPTTLLLKRV